MAFQIPVDFGRAAGDYAKHRQGYPPEFFARLSGLGVELAGRRALDIGSGTGALARTFVAAGAEVIALDPSAALLAEARRLEPHLRCVVGQAERLPFADASFELVSASSCWHWFRRDEAARETRRALAPGGRLLIAHLDFHRLPDSVTALTFDTVRAFEKQPPPTHQPTFLFPNWLGDLGEAGFVDFEAFAFTTPLRYTHDGWIGRMRANGRVGPAMDAETIVRWEAELRRRLAERYPDEPLIVPHRIFALVAR
jgi:SAM-dependent methyltransferase